jgi:pilus assembly protein Flp/PilA
MLKTVNGVSKERGATMVEYAIMIALIAVVAIAAITGIGTNTNTAFSKVNNAIKQQ